MTLQMTRPALLPGIPVGDVPPAPEPRRLLRPGTLLLAHATDGRTFTLPEHQQMWGPLPVLSLADLAASAERTGLVGAGGAGFPTHRKLAAMHDRKAGPVVVNGSEGESASGKDTVLLTHVPHLVLDGAVAAARAIGANKVIVRIPATRPEVIDTVRRAIGERRDRRVRISVSPGEDSFVAGEASAIVSSLRGGPSLPAPIGKPPMMGRSAVLLSNVETFARLAAAVRGFTTQSSLITVSGAVTTAGVLEVDPATTIGQILAMTGADTVLGAVITGGWHGTWLPASEVVLQTPMNRRAIRAIGAHFGAGALIVLPTDPCPVDVLLAVSDYLLGAGAGQCAPCVLGMAAARRDLLRGEPVIDRVQRRGLCAHPTATVAALQSGQRLLAAEIAAHSTGQCEVRS